MFVRLSGSGFGFRIWGLRLRFWGLEIRNRGLGLGCRVWDLSFTVDDESSM